MQEFIVVGVRASERRGDKDEETERSAEHGMDRKPKQASCVNNSNPLGPSASAKPSAATT
jgi:hypothetical protein